MQAPDAFMTVKPNSGIYKNPSLAGAGGHAMVTVGWGVENNEVRERSKWVDSCENQCVDAIVAVNVRRNTGLSSTAGVHLGRTVATSRSLWERTFSV